MSIAELFYAKQAQRAQRFSVPRRYKVPRGRHPLPPPHRTFLMEPLEPRLLLSVMPGLEPVLFIPGFGGTIAADTSEAGFDEWLTTRGIAPDKLQLDTLANSYDDLVQTLQNAGYSVNHVEAGKMPVYVVQWDWRVPVAPQDGTADGVIGGISAASISDSTFETGLDYLGWWLDKAADDWLAATGTALTSVDMVTHSTGGLVARSYIQSSAYGADGLPTVDDLVLSGVPSEGTADPWDMLLDDFDAKNASRVLGRVVDKAYGLLLSGHDIVGPAGTTIQAATWVDTASTREAFIGQYVGALHDLLPTYGFLDTNDDGIYELLSGADANGFLLDLNGNALDPDAFIDLTGSTTVIYSDEITTPTKAIQRFGPSITLEVLPFDEYIDNPVASGEIWYEQVSAANGGDGTVPTGSARPSWFDAANPKLSIQRVTSAAAGVAVGHTELVQHPYGQARVLDAIGVTGYTDADISTGLAKTDPEKLLAIIQLGLFDPGDMLAEAADEAADLLGALVDWGIDALAGAPHFTANDGLNVTIEGTAFADHLVLEDPDPAMTGRMRLRNLDDGSEVLVFDNPSVALTINLGDNALATLLSLFGDDLAGDKLTLASLDPAFAAALTINGGTGTGGTDVVIGTDVTLPGKSLSIAGDTVTLAEGRTVSTRQVAVGGDPLTAPSTGNSGSITFEAATIEVRTGARLLAHAIPGDGAPDAQPGDITLDATDLTPLSFPIPFVDIVTTASSITLDSAIVKGGKVTIESTADADRSWDALGPGFDVVIGFLDGLSEFGGVALSNADATIALRGATDIEASSLTLASTAAAEANVRVGTIYLGVAYGEANPTAAVTIEPGVKIATTGDVTVKTSADSTLDVEARQSYLGAAKDTEDVDVTIAVGTSQAESTAWVQAGSWLDVGGNLTVQALMTKSLDVSAAAGAYEDGAVGVAVAVSKSSSTAKALLDGNATVDGGITVEADSATTKNDTSTTAQTGTGVLGALTIKVKDKVGLSRETGFFFDRFVKHPDGRSGATPFALSAAFSWADHTNQAMARIGDGAHVGAQEDITIHASILDRPEITTRAFVDSQKLADANQGNTKETSVSTAIAIGNYRNNADAHIGRGAVVDAGQAIEVVSETQIPLVFDWLQFQVADPAEDPDQFAKDLLAELSEVANSNFGIENGLFTSWAQSNATGTKTALAVSVDIVNLTDTSHAYIAEGALVNQDTAFRTGMQDVRVEAYDLMEAMHLAGVVGLKILGTQAGSTGVGGSYLEVDYESAVTARILSGAQVYADSLIVRADAKTHNFDLAEAGGAADNLAINGAFSLVRVNNRTIAQIDDGAFVTLGVGHVAIPRVVRDRFEDATFGVLPFLFPGIAQVEDTLLALDTNRDGKVDQNDEDILAIDPGTDSGPGDDVLLTNLNQLVVAEDESTIINAGGGITKGQSVGVGFSVSINEIDRDTKALIGNRSTGFTPAGVDSGDDTITCDAPHGLVTGDAVVYDAGSGTPVGGLTNGQTYYVIVVDPHTVKLAASRAEALLDEPASVNLDATATTPDKAHALRDADDATGALAAGGRVKVAALNRGDISSYTISGAAATQGSTGTSLTAKDAPKGSGKYGIGVSVDVSVNTITDVTEAYVADSETSVSGATDLVLLARNPTVVTALAGSAAISTASGASGTLAGAWTQNTILGRTQAFIQDSTVALSGDLTLRAETSAKIAGNAASLSGAGKIGAAGSVVVNTIDVDTLAFIAEESDVTISPVSADGGSVTITARNTAVIRAIAAAPSFGGKAGIGASVAVNTIHGTTKASIEESDLAAAHDVLVRAETAAEITAGAAAIGAAQGPMAAAVAVTVNTIRNETTASISGRKTDGLHAVGTVEVNADDSSVIWSVAGNIAGSTGGAGIGVSTAVNIVDNTTTASIVGDAVVVSSSGDVVVSATEQAGTPTSAVVQWINNTLGLPEKSSITTLAIGGGFANEYGVFGSVAVSSVSNETRALIGAPVEKYAGGDDPSVTAYGSVKVSAQDDAALFSLAGGVAGAGSDAGGIASSTIVGTNIVEAWIGQNAAVFAGGHHDPSATEAGLLVTAESTEHVWNFAVGGAGAGTIGGAGSASVTVLNETTRAFIDQGAQINQGAGASDDQSVEVRAEDTTTLLGIAGALAGGGTAGIGAGADVGVLTKLTEAFIAPSATVYARNDVVVDAASTEDVSSISASVGGGGTAGIAGAAGVYVFNIRTRAFIGPDTGDRLPGLSGSPTLTFADAGLATEAITVTRSAGSWTADGFDQGRILTLSGSGPKDGTYRIDGVSDTELTLVPIYAPTVVTAEGSVVVSAADDTELDVIAGTIAGAGSTSVGASGAVPILNKTTEAFIGRDGIVDGKGLRAGLDVATGDFTIDFVQESFSLTELPAPAFFAAGTLKLDVTGDGQADLDEESLTRQRTASAETRNTKGVAVAAINQDDIETLGLSAGGSGGVSVNVGGSVQVTTTHTSAFVDADARINTDEAGAGSEQSVLIAAGSDYSHVGLAAVAAGAGGVAVTPGADVTVFNGTTEAYVADGAEVYAEQDILVAAHAAEDILSLTAGVAGSGTVSVGGAVSVIVVTSKAEAHIGDAAATDDDGAVAHAGGNVLVAATDDTDIDVIAGSLGIGIGAAGVGASVGVTVVTKDTRAWVGDHATVDAGGNGDALTKVFDGGITESGFSTEAAFHGLAVQAASSEYLTSVVASGAGGFYAGVAGGVSVEVIDSDTVASIGSNANINTDTPNAGADQSVNVSAVNDADVFVVAGGLGVGFVGVGGGVDVGVLRNDTSASIGEGAEVHARADVDVNALSRKTVDSIAVSAAGGVVGGAGSVSVWAIGSAFDATYAVDGQSGDGLATTGSDENTPQFADVASFADAMAGGEDPGNPKNQPNNGYTAILDGYDRFRFDPSLALDDTTDTIDLGPDHGLSTGDAVVYDAGGGESVGGLADGHTYYVIVDETDPDQVRLASSLQDALVNVALDLTPPAVPASGHSLSPLVGTATAGAGKDIEDAAPEGAVAAATESAEVAPGTIAFIGSGAIVTAGDDVNVRAKEEVTVLALTGSAAAGAVGIGGSVTVVNIRSNTVAYIAGDDPSTQAVEAGATVSAGSDPGDDILVEATLDEDVRGFAYAGQAGLYGLGAQVVVVRDTSAQAAYVQEGAEILKTDTLEIAAESDRLVRANATGGNLGGVAVGASVAVADVGGSTTAFLGGAEVGLAGAAVRNMKITADSSATADVDTAAVAAGIVAGSGSVASATVDPTVQAFIGDGAQILVTDNILVEARSLGLVTADAWGIGLSGIGVGISRADATWSPTIIAFVGASSSVMAGTDISVLASSNRDESGATDTTKVTRSNATSSSGSLVGGVGADATATTTANVAASIGDGSTLTAGNDVTVRSLSSSTTQAVASGKAFAIAGGGITTARSSITNVNLAFTGDNVSIAAGRNLTLSAQTIINSNADVTGGAGGVLAGASTKASTVVDDQTTVAVGDGSTVTAGGMLLVEALMAVDAHSKAGIATGAAATFNLTEANTYVASHTRAEVGTDATVIGNTVEIHAKVTKLDADANAFSKTIAAYSTTDARSFVDVISDTAVIIQSGADITGKQRLELIARQDGVDVDSDAVATILAGLTGTVRATGHNKLDLDSNVDIRAGSTLVSDNVFVQAESPKNEDTYGHTADADAQTIVQTVVETLRVVQKAVRKIPIIGWFVKWITKLVTVVSQVILQSNESALLTGAFTSDNAINLAGDIFQGASSSPRLLINADGSFDAFGVTADLVGNEVIVSDITGGQGAGSILLSSPGGAVSGNGTIHKNSNFAAVTIVNNSNLNLTINDIRSINPNAVDADLQIESDPAKDSSSFNIVADLGSGVNSPVVSIQNNTAADVLFAGEIENPTGITIVTNQGGDILGLLGAFLEGNALTLLAPGGHIGNADSPLHLRLYADGSNATLTAVAGGGIYLDARLLEIGDSSTPVSSADVIDGVEFTHVVAGGDITIHALQPQVLVPSEDPGGLPTLTDVRGAYHLNNVTSTGGNVTIVVDSGDLHVGSVHSPLGTSTLVASRSILDDVDGGALDVTASGAVLSAGAGIGEADNPLETAVGRLEAAAVGGGLWIENTGGLTIGGISGFVGVNAAGPVAVTALSPLTIAEDVVSGGDISLTATDSPGPGDDLVVTNGASVRTAAGSIVLSAGDTLRIDPGSIISASGPVTLLVDQGDADPGVGGIVDIGGEIHGSSAEVAGGNDADVVSVTNVAEGTPMTVRTFGGNDTIYVGSHATPASNSGGTAHQIAALLTVDGGGQEDILSVDDTGDTLANTGVLTQTSLAGLGMGGGLTYTAIEDLRIALGSGGDTVTIDSTHGGMTTLTTNEGDDIIHVRATAGATVVNAGVGNDTIHVSSDAPMGNGTLDDILGVVTIDAGGGVNTLHVSDEASGTPDVNGVITVSSILGLAPVAIHYAATGGTFGGGINIEGGFGGNRIEVRSTHESQGTTTTLWSGEGDDVVLVTEIDPTSLIIHGEAGDDVIDAAVVATDLVITGDSGDDLITSGAGDDLISGDQGDDQIIAGLGADDVSGGEGQDVLLGDTGLITRAFNTDGSWRTDVLLTDVGTIAGAYNPNGLAWADLNAAVVSDLLNADLVLLTGAYNADGSRHVVPNAWGCPQWETGLLLISLLPDGPDVLDGGTGDDALFGGRGDDRLSGGAGRDYVVGNAGNDELNGGDDDDTLVGDEATHVASSSALPNVLHGLRLIAGANGNGPVGDVVLDDLGTTIVPVLSVVPSQDLDPVAGVLTHAGHDLSVIPAPNALTRLDGSRLVPLASIVPDVRHHLDLVAGNDNLFGGAGNDTLVGDNLVVFQPTVTATTEFLASAFRVTWDLLEATDDVGGLLHRLEHAVGEADGDHPRVDHHEVVVDQTLRIANDELDGGSGNDFLVGDDMTVTAPSLAVPVGLVHDLHQFVDATEAVGYEAAWALQELDEAAHDLRDVVVPTSHGKWVHNHLVHHIDRIVDGNDRLVGGDGDDVVVGDNWNYAAPRVTVTPGGSPWPGHPQWNDQWCAHHHQDDHDGPGDEWIIGNDTLDGGAGSDLMFGDSVAVVVPVMASAPGVRWWDFCAVRRDVEGILEDLVEMARHQSIGQGWLPDDDHEHDSGGDCHGVIAGNDSMVGGDGDDILFGQGGDDTLRGGAGNDWLVGGNGQDTLDKGTGKDRISHGNDYSKDLREKVQERLINWARSASVDGSLGGPNGSTAQPGDLAPRLLDFAAAAAPANGNGHGHNAQGAPTHGQVAWGPLNGKDGHGLEVVEFAIALKPEVR